MNVPSMNCVFVALFTTAQLEAIKMSLNRCMEKQPWDIHTVEHHSARKRNVLLVHAATHVNLKGVRQSKRS